MRTRIWIRSGIEETLDERQQRLINLVKDKIKHYYQDLHLTQTRYQYPLSLSMLMKLTNRNGSAVMTAVRILANTIEATGPGEPEIYYDRTESEKNRSHRPYRIFLRKPSRNTLSERR